MALITCPECGREVSDKAASCPGWWKRGVSRTFYPAGTVTLQPDISIRVGCLAKADNKFNEGNHSTNFGKNPFSLDFYAHYAHIIVRRFFMLFVYPAIYVFVRMLYSCTSLFGWVLDMKIGVADRC